MVKKLLLLITIASNIFLFAQNKKSKKEQKETIDSIAQNGGLDMVLLQKKNEYERCCNFCRYTT